jgi:hypothetical protein
MLVFVFHALIVCCLRLIVICVCDGLLFKSNDHLLFVCVVVDHRSFVVCNHLMFVFVIVVSINDH